MRLERLFALTALVVAGLGAHAGAARADTRRYAMIIAYSGDSDGELKPLDYADDDGALYYEQFSALADHVALYTVLDEDSQRQFPKVAKVAKVPKRADVLAGLADEFDAMQKDLAAGDDVVFYFVLVGHGKLGSGGEGYVSLLDGSFSRTDVFQEVLAKSPATTNHVIVDACDAYYLVHRRGGGADEVDDGGPSRRDAVTTFVAKEELSNYPNTGVLLSTSSEKETHEWSAYRAGVFSHELRSALAGGADVNGDGLVEYAEVEAFLAAANQHVSDPDAHVDVFAQAPAVDASRPLADLKHATFPHWLEVPAGDPLRFYLEDARGVRYLDAHVDGERSVVFGLPSSAYYYVRTDDDEQELRIKLGSAVRVALSRKKLAPPKIAARGAVAEAFQLHLYEEPFGADYFRGFAAGQDGAAVDLDAPQWRPGPADADYVDAELRRLNAVARGDDALKERLVRSAKRLARALAAGEYDRALELLQRAEADGP